MISLCPYWWLLTFTDTKCLCEQSANGMMEGGKETFHISLGFLELFLPPVVKVECPSYVPLAI